MFRFGALFIAILVVTVISVVSALAADGEKINWRVIVTDDIWVEHGCKVAFFSHIVERETETGSVVLVKVHCEDKRSFDAAQSGAEEPFTFKECTPRATKTC